MQGIVALTSTLSTTGGRAKATSEALSAVIRNPLIVLEKAGFLYRRSAGVDLFLDGPEAKARDAVHVVFAGEKVRPHEPLPNPDVAESEMADRFRVLSLPALVQVKLTAFRDKDRTHLRDLLDVGLIDASWTARLPSELAARLQTLIDTPEG